MTTRFYTNFFAASKRCLPRRLAASPSEARAPRHLSSSSLSSTLIRSQAKSPLASSLLNSSSFCSIYTHPRLSLPARKDRFLSPEAQDSARHGKARRPLSLPTSSRSPRRIRASSPSSALYCSLLHHRRPNPLVLLSPPMPSLSRCIFRASTRHTSRNCRMYAEIISGFSVTRITPSGSCPKRTRTVSRSRGRREG
jgi:hypothetical protein